MRISFLLALLFVVLSVLESSLLWVFQPAWFSAFPLLSIAGFLVLQRVGVSEGVMWFLAMIFLRHDLSSLIIIALAPVLIVRLFSTRSVYALLGSGITAYGAMILGILAGHAVLRTLGIRIDWHMPFSFLLAQWALLVPGLYLGFVCVRWLERTVGSRVALKPLT